MTHATMHSRIGGWRPALGLALGLAAACSAAAQQLPPVPRSDVTFRTVTIRYPFDREVRVPMVGTERFGANVSGEAIIERRSTITKISLTLKRLPARPRLARWPPRTLCGP